MFSNFNTLPTSHKIAVALVAVVAGVVGWKMGTVIGEKINETING